MVGGGRRAGQGGEGKGLGCVEDGERRREGRE